MKKRRFKKLGLAIALFGLLSGGMIQANSGYLDYQIDKDYRLTGNFYTERQKSILAKGVTYEKISHLTKEGWLDLYVLRLDLEEPTVGLDILRATDWGSKKKVSALADNNQRLTFGAINGSFFNMKSKTSDIMGNEFEDKVVELEKFTNTQEKSLASLIKEKSGRTYFDYFGATFIVNTNQGRPLYIKGINCQTDDKTPVIFNDKAYSTSEAIDKVTKGYKIVVVDDQVTELVGPEATAIFPEQGFVIFMPQAIAQYHLSHFTVGTRLKLAIDSTLPLDDLSLLMTGGGKILENGQIVNQGMVVQGGRRHPRTALALNQEGNQLMMVVIDGRRQSLGATHNELANYLLAEGAYNAIHMDGGGSSTMVVRPTGQEKVKVNNRPSGKVERKVVNALSVVSTVETGKLDRLFLTADKEKTFLNRPIKLTLKGIDANYRPVSIDSEAITWGVEGVEAGFASNYLYPKTEGQGTVVAYYNGLKASLPIKVSGQASALMVEPKVLQVKRETTGHFRLLATDRQGFSELINPDEVTYQLDDETIGYFEKGIFHPSQKGGKSKVTIGYRGAEDVAYVVVGQTVRKGDLTTYPIEVQAVTGITGQFIKKQEQGIGHSLVIEYAFQSAEESMEETTSQSLIGRFEKPLSLDVEADKIRLQIMGVAPDVTLKAHFRDDRGNAYPVDLTTSPDYERWSPISFRLPKSAVYPVKLERLELVNDDPTDKKAGKISLAQFDYIEKIGLDQFPTSAKQWPTDELLLAEDNMTAPLLSLFGSTAGRNRLLDKLLLDKAVGRMKLAKDSLFLGAVDLEGVTRRPTDQIWKNQYSVTDKEAYRLIQLATGEGGLRVTDGEQFKRLQDDLLNSVQNTIIVVADRQPLRSFKDVREGHIVHQMLSDYQRRSGKTIYYVTAEGYETEVYLKDGIRYIHLNGLWYHVKRGREIDLNQSFYTLNFYEQGGQVYYMLDNLYPLIEKGQ